MKRNKLLLIIIILFAWLLRVIYLNKDGDIKNQYTKEVYQKGDDVSFEDNVSEGMNEYNGYSLKVEKLKVEETSDYMEALGVKNKNSSSLISEKVIEVTVGITNYGDKNEEGIFFPTFPIYGWDWYTYSNSEVTGYANDIFENEPAFGIIVPYGKSTEVKIVYPLFREGMSEKRWSEIQNESMYMGLTIQPKARVIKLN